MPGAGTQPRGSGNVVLVGFMGSGKSSVGRIVARDLAGRFVDTDRLVVEREGCEITDLFASRGEAGFRAAETAALRSLASSRGLVVATGGGIVTVPENGPLLAQLGLVVWLTAREEIIWDRVSRNRKRPMLHTANPRQTVRELLEERNPLYAALAQVRIDTSDSSHEDVAAQVCAAVEGRRQR